ncbi:hypothetical protein M569_17577, partial [Genlisea aurea]
SPGRRPHAVMNPQGMGPATTDPPPVRIANGRLSGPKTPCAGPPPLGQQKSPKRAGKQKPK